MNTQEKNGFRELTSKEMQHVSGGQEVSGDKAYYKGIEKLAELEAKRVEKESRS